MFWGGPPAAPVTGLFSYSGKSAEVIDGADARMGFGARRVDGDDAGVGVRASEDFGVKHPGQVDVRAVSGSARDFVITVVPDGTLADGGVVFGCGSRHEYG